MPTVFDRYGLSRTTRVLLLTALGLALLHHADHVLRVDHSGWPFRPRVTPFTFSLLAYPMLFFALWGPRRLAWLRWTLLGIGTAFTVVAHVAIETPAMQIAMWADDRSLDPAGAGLHNLLGTHSVPLGYLAAAIAMALNVAAVVATVSMLADLLRQRSRG